MVLSSRETTNPEFWRGRLKTAPRPIDAIGVGFNWTAIDSGHLKIVKNLIKLEDKILDVACGIGRCCEWFDPLKYVGFDFMPEFIEIARREHPKYDFRIADLRQKLPFKDEEFEWAILVSVKAVLAPNFGDLWPEAEKELKRVAKKVLILEYGNSDPQYFNQYEIL